MSLLVGQGHWAFSGRSELALVVCGCEGEAVVDWLTLRSVFLVWVPTWLTYSQKPRAVLDWLTFKSEFTEASFFHFLLEFFFLSASFITSWCGSQSNCSLVVRNYWKPVFRKPFTKSILRIYKAFGGVKCVMLFCCFCYNIVTTKLRVLSSVATKSIIICFNDTFHQFC